MKVNFKKYKIYFYFLQGIGSKWSLQIKNYLSSWIYIPYIFPYYFLSMKNGGRTPTLWSLKWSHMANILLHFLIICLGTKPFSSY